MHVMKAVVGLLTGKPDVRTLDRDLFRTECLRLANEVRDTGFFPTHIVAIAQGGVPVAQAMVPFFDGSEIVVVTKKRPTTQLKEESGGSFQSLMKSLPVWVTSFLRRVEHWSRYEEVDYKTEFPAPTEIELSKLNWPEVKFSGSARVLIVDDAVDTGHTLAFVTFAAERFFPAGSLFKTAAITVSGVNPFADCDYKLYRDVNVRFFWSGDFRE